MILKLVNETVLTAVLQNSAKNLDKLITCLATLLLNATEWQQDASALEKIFKAAKPLYPEIIKKLIDVTDKSLAPLLIHPSSKKTLQEIIVSQPITAKTITFIQDTVSKDLAACINRLRELPDTDDSRLTAVQEKNAMDDSQLHFAVHIEYLYSFKYIFELIPSSRKFFEFLKQKNKANKCLLDLVKERDNSNDDIKNQVKPYELLYQIEICPWVSKDTPWFITFAKNCDLQFAAGDVTFLSHAILYRYPNLVSWLVERNAPIILSLQNATDLIPILTSEYNFSASVKILNNVKLQLDYKDLDLLQPLYFKAKSQNHSKLKETLLNRVQDHIGPQQQLPEWMQSATTETTIAGSDESTKQEIESQIETERLAYVTRKINNKDSILLRAAKTNFKLLELMLECITDKAGLYHALKQKVTYRYTVMDYAISTQKQTRGSTLFENFKFLYHLEISKTSTWATDLAKKCDGTFVAGDITFLSQFICYGYKSFAVELMQRNPKPAFILSKNNIQQINTALAYYKYGDNFRTTLFEKVATFPPTEDKSEIIEPLCKSATTWSSSTNQNNDSKQDLPDMNNDTYYIEL